MENCNHLYSRGMNEPRPRLCIHCKEPEVCQACLGNGELHMCGKTFEPELKVDMEYYKDYVKTYPNVLFGPMTFVEDMLYGIGLSVNPERYQGSQGYKKFLKEVINEKVIKKYDHTR
jgi:hypothetical protein